MKNNPFFIIGVGRSGTSLIRMMFHNHPRIAIPYESHFITKYQDRMVAGEGLNGEKNLDFLVDEMLKEPYLKMWDHNFDRENVKKRISESTLRGVVQAIYEEYAAGKGKVRWGDKSDYLDRMHMINEIFPDAQFIHIIRDGRDVARSVMKLSWGPNDIISAAEWWNKYLWLGRRVGAVLGKERYTEVFYEELVAEPERELKRLCAFLGEEFSEEMLNYHQQADKAIPDSLKGQHYNVNEPPKKSRTFAWKKEMHPLDVAIFSRYASEMLAEVKYELPKGGGNKALVLLRILGIILKRFM